MTPHPLLHPFAPPTRTSFQTIVRGEGAHVWDDQGRRYVDATASLWYCNAGHGRPEIIAAITDQLRRLDAFNVFDTYTNEPAERLAERIAARSPIEDPRVFLTCSGSEAVDTALKLARLWADRTGQKRRHVLVGRPGSYHGTNFGGVSVQGLPRNREGWGPLLEHVDHFGADDLAAAEALFSARGHEIAAVIAEPVIGAGGVIPPAPGYLAGLRRLCDEHGALLILDEVITGFGRLGSWFGADHYGVTPDLLTFAKAVTSGYQPVGGVVIGPAVRAALEDDPDFVLRHGYTYSGHPTACAAALANLDVLEQHRLLERVPVIAERLGTGLAALAADGVLAASRGVGGMWAAVLPPGRSAGAVRPALAERGVLARAIGDDVIAFCPPLVIEADDLDRCVAALGDAVRATR